MKVFHISATAVLLIGLTQPVMAEPSGKELAALEQKMHGLWKSRGGCDGHFHFRADGTYELTEFGPGHQDTAGTWKVRWDALPPTLILTRKTSEIPGEVGKTMEVKLVQLDDKSLAIEYSVWVGHYTRAKK